MKISLLGFFLFFLNFTYGQKKSQIKIVPIDVSILKLSTDTIERPELIKPVKSYDYVIMIDKKTLKQDTVLIYPDLYVDKKRKIKN
jgi:hypothetical protein